ncbi:hypothetical protein KIH39_20375 [Telmatocola sphagniphila]|uniref:Lipoprotein n=1 Tax=Telmatocola sphagniphila TaxID=1123043 RepID=A0A8E6B3I0_9BACT|nr:hypothetical protein [Telmatocola sphagniphila]QVL31182.1 hypothetical protein KIH39_20375 [Telmatocola sphagniphila]
MNKWLLVIFLCGIPLAAGCGGAKEEKRSAQDLEALQNKDQASVDEAERRLERPGEKRKR